MEIRVLTKAASNQAENDTATEPRTEHKNQIQNTPSSKYGPIQVRNMNKFKLKSESKYEGSNGLTETQLKEKPLKASELFSLAVQDGMNIGMKLVL